MSFAMLVLTAVCTIGVVCGGSDGGGPTDVFVGRWIKDFDIPIANMPDVSGFDFVCTDPNFTMFNTNFLVWSEINFEHGVVTDLFEALGNCSFSWDIDGSGKVAIVFNPDPIIGEVLGCVISFSYLDAVQNELLVAMLIELFMGDVFKFTLFGTKNAVGVFQVEFRGTAFVIIQRLDVVGTLFETIIFCSYVGMDMYFRFTQS